MKLFILILLICTIQANTQWEVIIEKHNDQIVYYNAGILPDGNNCTPSLDSQYGSLEVKCYNSIPEVPKGLGLIMMEDEGLVSFMVAYPAEPFCYNKLISICINNIILVYRYYDEDCLNIKTYYKFETTENLAVNCT